MPSSVDEQQSEAIVSVLSQIYKMITVELRPLGTLCTDHTIGSPHSARAYYLRGVAGTSERR